LLNQATFTDEVKDLKNVPAATYGVVILELLVRLGLFCIFLNYWLRNPDLREENPAHCCV
jgi:hypothetical protein